MDSLFHKTLKGENNKIAIWLMRQAGRYLAEYRAVRATAPNFMEFCYNPELATKVTLQPIERFGFDMSIIFSDILTIPDALGMNVEFVKGEGPKLSGFDINSLKFDINKVSKVFDAVSNTRKQLPKNTPLIGFSACPWTLAAYMIEGSGSKDFSKAKAYAYSNPKDFARLIDLLVESISQYLCRKIEAGADVIKLFDSWAGLVSSQKFDDWCVEPTRKIVENVKAKYPDIPIIIFPKGCGYQYPKYVEFADVLAFDYSVPLDIIADIQKDVVVQGNLDPSVLLGSQDEVKLAIDNILAKLGCKNFIFNLGHGILPTTPIENVEFLIETVRKFDVK